MFAGFFSHLFSGVTLYFTLAIFGAVAGFLCALIGRQSYLISAGVGAALVIFMHVSGVLSGLSDAADKQKIADLEAQNAKLVIEAQRLKEINDFTEQEVAVYASKLTEREKQYGEVLKLIDKHKDDNECISAEELDAIGKMK